MPFLLVLIFLLLFAPVIFWVVLAGIGFIVLLYGVDFIKEIYIDGTPDKKLDEVMRTYH